MKKIFLSLILIFGSIDLLSATTSPQGTLKLRIEPEHFSPNNDNLQDQTFFYPVLATSKEISRWLLDIRDSKKKKRVARLSGAGLPALIKWEGLDKKGQSVPDGTYEANLTAFGNRIELKAESTFVVDTQVPLVSLRVSTPVFDRSFLGNGALTFFPNVKDSSPIDHWLLQILDESGRTVRVFWSSGSVLPVNWDGTDESTGVLVPPGVYRVAFQAWDKANNESSPSFLDVQMNVTPREMLEHSLRIIQVNETALGLIVQLPAEKIFQTIKGQLQFSDQAPYFLREVAILINAYPDATAKLEGYAKVKKQYTKDRDLASMYAWRVYSYLIKTGHVKASRLSVRGRGRSAMFDRRSVGVPLLNNGVEIVLEGDPPW